MLPRYRVKLKQQEGLINAHDYPLLLYPGDFVDEENLLQGFGKNNLLVRMSLSIYTSWLSTHFTCSVWFSKELALLTAKVPLRECDMTQHEDTIYIKMFEWVEAAAAADTAEAAAGIQAAAGAGTRSETI